MTLLPPKDPITRYYHIGEQGFNKFNLGECKHSIQSNNLHFYLFSPSPLYLCSIPVNLAQLMFFVSVLLLIISPHFYLKMSKVYNQTYYKLITSLFVFCHGLRSQAEIKCSPLLLIKLLEERSFKDILLHGRKQTITQDRLQLKRNQRDEQSMFNFCSQTNYLTLSGRRNEWVKRPEVLLQLKFLCKKNKGK